MSDTAKSNHVLKAAQRLIAAEISVIPINLDGSKSPAISTWKQWQTERAPGELIDRWFGNGDVGIAIIGGHVSGNLLILDFDVIGLADEWEDLMREYGYADLVASLPCAETPRGGRHYYLRSETPVKGSEKIAQTADRKTRIETKAEGGYAIIAPSAGYKMLRGRPYAPACICEDDLGIMLAFAAAFNEYVEPETVADPKPPRVHTDGKRSPGDHYNEEKDYAEILLAHGWQIVARRGEVGLWRRPGKIKGISATSNHGGFGYFTVFSTNAHPFEYKKSYDAFGIYARLEHGGDFSEAASALAFEGYGDKAETEKPEYAHNGRKRRAGVPPVVSTAEEPQGRTVDLSEEDMEHAAADAQEGEGNKGPSEITLARAWARTVKSEFRYVEGDQWYRYRAGFWKYSSIDVAVQSVQLWLMERRRKDKKISVTPAKVRNVLFLAKSLLGPHPVEEFNSHADWIPLLNGVYDTTANVVLPHSPENLFTYQFPFEHHDGAVCPLWTRCLNEWMLETDGTTCQEWLDILQEWFGYCCIPDATAQTAMLWTGEGGNGKGVATRVLENMVGTNNHTAIPIENLHEPYHRADLHGKLIGFVNEPDPRAMQKNGNHFKAITGGDSISARRPTEKVFSFTPFCRIIVSCNDLPSTRDLSRGFFRRIILIDWRYNVPAELQDPDLDDKLRSEMSGIFNWAMEGLRRLKARNRKFVVPKSSKELLEDYKMGEDSLSRFLEEECDKGEGLWISNADFYRAYKTWCEQFSERPQPQTVLAKRLPKMGFASKKKRLRGAVPRGWDGICLKNADDGDE